MARAATVVSLTVSFSGISADAEGQKGFYFGAGWPGGGQVHLFGNRQNGARIPSNGLMMQSYQEAAALDRLQQHLDRHHSNGSTSLPVQLRAGYDFGRVLGYLSLDEAEDLPQLQTDDSNLSLGVAVPLAPNIQFSGEVRQSDNAAGSDTHNVWSVTAGFRF